MENEFQNTTLSRMCSNFFGYYLIRGEYPANTVNKLKGRYVKVEDSDLKKDPKKYYGLMVMAYLPEISDSPIQVRIASYRSGILRVAWKDSTGVEFAPYAVESDSLICLPVESKNKRSVISIISSILRKESVQHKISGDVISICGGKYTIEHDDDSIFVLSKGRIILSKMNDDDGIKYIARSAKTFDSGYDPIKPRVREKVQKPISMSRVGSISVDFE